MVVEVWYRICSPLTPTHSEIQGEKLFRSFDVNDENDVYDSFN
jgi:hypothetical protein